MGIFGCETGMSQKAVSVTGTNSSGSSAFVKLGDLTNAGNPNRSKYREWDTWLVEHQVSEAEVDYSCSEENVVILRGILDKDGWLVPNIELERQVEESAKAGTSMDFAHSLKFDVFAQGEMDSGMQAELHEEVCKMKAGYFRKYRLFSVRILLKKRC
jgi:hypothetical protein